MGIIRSLHRQTVQLQRVTLFYSQAYIANLYLAMRSFIVLAFVIVSSQAQEKKALETFEPSMKENGNDGLDLAKTKRPPPPPCPVQKFMDDHVCIHCKDLNDALSFSEKKKTSAVNTVVMGMPNFKRVDKGTLCGSSPLPLVKCVNLQNNEPIRCEYLFQGQKCSTEHSTANGHMSTPEYCFRI